MTDQNAIETAATTRFAPNRLLASTDLSDESRKSLAYAAVLAQQFHASLCVLFVVEAAPFAAGIEAVPITMPQKATETAARRELDAWLRTALPAGLEVTSVTREGKPAATIVAVAKELEIDMIVIATRGRGAMKRLLLGSTTEQVVRQASCPVLVVRELQREPLLTGA